MTADDPVERKHGQKLHSVRSASRGKNNMRWTREREQIMDDAFGELRGDWRGHAA